MCWRRALYAMKVALLQSTRWATPLRDGVAGRGGAGAAVCASPCECMELAARAPRVRTWRE